MTDKEKIKAEIERLISELGEQRDINLEDLLDFINSLPEEPVSEDLEKAALLYYPKMSRISEPHGIIPADNKSHYLGDANEDNRQAFIVGANWQKEQFEKNRLAACNALTKEQAQMESGFVTKHLKENNRTPTFIDAIEYGMKLQKEQMMKDAIDAVIHPDDGEIWTDKNDLEKYEECQKVKVIIMKEEQI